MQDQAYKTGSSSSSPMDLEELRKQFEMEKATEIPVADSFILIKARYIHYCGCGSRDDYDGFFSVKAGPKAKEIVDKINSHKGNWDTGDIKRLAKSYSGAVHYYESSSVPKASAFTPRDYDVYRLV